MAFITLNTFVDGLEALVVAGVVRSYIHGPPSGAVSTADLPAKFVHLPGISGATRLAFGNQGGKGSLQAQVIILVEPVVQGRPPENFDATVDLVDAFEAALIAAGCSIGGILGWSVRVTIFSVAEIDYWAVVADVEGNHWQ